MTKQAWDGKGFFPSHAVLFMIRMCGDGPCRSGFPVRTDQARLQGAP